MKRQCPRWCEHDVNGTHVRHVGMRGDFQVDIRQKPGEAPRISIVDPEGDDKLNLHDLTTAQVRALLALLDDGWLIGAENLVMVAWELAEANENPDDDPEHLRRCGATPVEHPGLLKRLGWACSILAESAKEAIVR